MVGLQERRYASTVRIFEAAAQKLQVDYRPLFLYWSARSHAKLDAPARTPRNTDTATVHGRPPAGSCPAARRRR
jgi:hypothetical protein